jgi:hypothetical protein
VNWRYWFFFRPASVRKIGPLLPVKAIVREKMAVTATARNKAGATVANVV